MTNFLFHKLKAWQVLALLTILLSLLTLTGFMGKLWWIFDITSHFRVQYFILLTIFSLFFLLGKKHHQTLLAGFFAIVNLSTFATIGFGEPHPPSEKQVFKAVIINLAVQNTSYQKIKIFIREVNPDILILEEYNKGWRQNLKNDLVVFNFKKVSSMKNGWGIGLFSKLPFKSAKAGSFGYSPIPLVKARIYVGSQLITFVGAHLQDPTTEVRTDIRNRQLNHLAKLLRIETNPVMLLGDLNISLFSPFFTDFLEMADLMDSRQGRGLKPTWPTYFPPLLVPLDHCLISPEIDIHSITLGPDVGSDHYPIIVDFSPGKPT